jgi:hypothetical protein
MFNVSLIGETELIARFDGMGEAVQRELRLTVQMLAKNLQGFIVTQKLHGQVLGQRSGKLVQSIQEESPIEEGAGVYGRVFQSGDVKYGKFWEYGFHGTETVKQHFRSMVFGKDVAPFSVGPYERKVDEDARPFMRPSLAEYAPTISAELKKAVLRGMGAKG